MNKRQSIKKSIRFEVFKRDSFQCQYCGQSAPDCILEIDHITPVAKNGDNDITNLITSCRDCNSGKGARELDDNSVLKKQKEQLDDLNERRNQMEMMVQWRESIRDIREKQVNAICDAIASHDTGYGVSDHGLSQIRKWVKRFSFNEVLLAVDVSFEQYIEREENGDAATKKSWEKAFSYIPKIIGMQRKCGDKPYLKELFYVRGILRNRLNYINERVCIKLLEAAFHAGASIDSLKDFALSTNNWTAFREETSRFIEEHGGLEE